MVVFLIVGLITPLSFSNAQETVEIRLKRTFGMAFGDTIQGTFTVVGIGSDNIINLTLLFDGNVVSFIETNSLSYRFQTKEYEPGDLNMTLVGYDSSGNSYSSTKIVNVMTPTLAIIVITCIMLLVVVAVFIKYGSRIINYFRVKKNKNRKDDPVSDET